MSETDILKLLADPDAVHLNLLRGTLARPSVEQIVHLYGAEALRAALPSPPDPDERVAELERAIAEQAALLEDRFSDLDLVGFENGTLTLKGPLIPLLAEAMAQMLRPTGRSEPANYTETALTHEELGPLTLTLQRKTGATAHELRVAAETRADQAERRERALLASNQRERSALTQLASLRSRLRDAGRRAEADPERAGEILRAAVREGGAL
ncbi:hypothetical protein IQ03_01294 [Gemmobacter caeni]|uniref:Uncharacterized protein n=1 Tax=Gemmobacter caeni TaxID=589035 RepID=A0A2T6B8R8_9RHOB|nr:hypothetical protein [Gemmobacter caeni]PTX52453.1 hypothetical protein C8N34_102233 [Gemmobacter caeni]TWJ02876.1 hypothetical protein IQ03_01294 [Gemmobacter caeni]